MLRQYARADESKNTGLKILEHCCNLQVTGYNNETCAGKALHLLIESGLLSLFINKSDYHGELILNWIFQMPDLKNLKLVKLLILGFSGCPI